MNPKKEIEPELNFEHIDYAVLALLYLNLHDCGVAWKGFDWEAMNRLYEKGFISNPVSKSKSVGFTEEGVRFAQQIFEQIFLVKKS